MYGPFVVTLWLVSAMTLTGATHRGLRDCQPAATCDAAAVAEFSARVRDYLALRHEAERGLLTERLFDDPGEMLAVRKVLRQTIREARPGARAGDLFTPSAAAAFRHIIAATVAAQRVNPKDIVHELRAERMAGARDPAVNGAYDWRLGAWMWPALLQALPPLPPDLQYRIVDDDLVLIDVRAGLVVDILENAMAVDED